MEITGNKQYKYTKKKNFIEKYGYNIILYILLKISLLKF